MSKVLLGDVAVEHKETCKGSNISIIIPPIDEQREFLTLVRQSDKSKFELEKALSELTATYKRIIAENLG